MAIAVIIIGYLLAGAVVAGITIGIMMDHDGIYGPVETWAEYPWPIMVLAWPVLIVVVILAGLAYLLAISIIKHRRAGPVCYRPRNTRRPARPDHER